MEKQYLTAISIVAGIITLIDENGEIKMYRQRGINQLSQEVMVELIRVGFLCRNWYDFTELPKHISIRYEDEEILGRACAVYPIRQAAKMFELEV